MRYSPDLRARVRDTRRSCMGQPTERGSHSPGRRAFLRSGAIGGAAALLTATHRHAEAPLDAEPLPVAPPASRFELDEVTIADLQERMEAGRSSAVEIADVYLKRIVELDRKGPTLRSVLETNPDALADARMLDAERKA